MSAGQCKYANVMGGGWGSGEKKGVVCNGKCFQVMTREELFFTVLKLVKTNKICKQLL